MPRLLSPVSAFLLCAAPVVARCQLPDLPPAPTQKAPAAAKPTLALPPASYDRPTGPAPDPKKGWICDAPPTAVFLDAFDTHPEKNGAVLSYVGLIRTEIYDTWIKGLPRSARNAWAKGRVVKVRFAILPDGSFSPPELTVSSGRSDYDDAAINAIRRHGTFPPPPPGPWKHVAMCMTFASNTGPQENPPSWSNDPK